MSRIADIEGHRVALRFAEDECQEGIGDVDALVIVGGYEKDTVGTRKVAQEFMERDPCIMSFTLPGSERAYDINVYTTDTDVETVIVKKLSTQAIGVHTSLRQYITTS